MDWKSGNDTILAFNELIRDQKVAPYEGKLKVGVDLGTANIVVAVVDENNKPVAGATKSAHVVRAWRGDKKVYLRLSPQRN